MMYRRVAAIASHYWRPAPPPRCVEIGRPAAGPSYDDPELIRFRIERAKLHRSNAGVLVDPGFLMLMGAVTAERVPPSVLDFGGGVGGSVGFGVGVPQYRPGPVIEPPIVIKIDLVRM